MLQAKCGRVRRDGHGRATSNPGPVVTTYEFKPDAGVKYSKVVGLADDLALGLEAESIRIDRMSGKGTVGIEIPNQVRETISLREMLESEAFRTRLAGSRWRSARPSKGDTYDHRPGQMPHLLIAGATGPGKSVGPQLHDRSILFQVDARRGAPDPDRPEAARAGRLRGHPPPAHARRHRPEGRRQRAQVGGRRDGAADPQAGLRGRAQHRAVQQHHPRRGRPSATTRTARSCGRCTTS